MTTKNAANPVFPAYTSMAKYVSTYNKIVDAICDSDTLVELLEGIIDTAKKAKTTATKRDGIDHLVYAKAILGCLAFGGEDVAMVLNGIKDAAAFPETVSANPLLYVPMLDTAINECVSSYDTLSKEEKLASCTAEDPCETFRNIIDAYSYTILKVKVSFERASGMHFLAVEEGQKPFSLEWLASVARTSGGLGSSADWADSVEALVALCYRINYEAVFGRKPSGYVYAISPVAKARAEQCNASKTAVEKLLNEIAAHLGEVDGKKCKATNHHAALLLGSSLKNDRLSPVAWQSADLRDIYERVYKILSNIYRKKIELVCRSVTLEK